MLPKIRFFILSKRSLNFFNKNVHTSLEIKIDSASRLQHFLGNKIY